MATLGKDNLAQPPVIQNTLSSLSSQSQVGSESPSSVASPVPSTSSVPSPSASPSPSALQSPSASAEASPVALQSPAALKNGIVQILTELNKDPEFKQMIANKALDYAYSAIEEKTAKNTQLIAELSQLQKSFENVSSTDLESLNAAVSKFNQDFKNIIAINGPVMSGGGMKRQKTMKRKKVFTRPRSSSRAFRKTHGRK
jgi:hypothetical protein